jgi:hypothetical protein
LGNFILVVKISIARKPLEERRFLSNFLIISRKVHETFSAKRPSFAIMAIPWVISSTAEQLTLNQLVDGSNPSSPI